MRVLLIDTNIASNLFNHNHSLRAKCVKEIDDGNCLISFMTRAELLLWPNTNSWGAERRAHLDEHIKQFTTLLPDEEVCARWADVMAESRRAGRPMATSDAWIAATAIRWNLSFLTADYRDFNHLKNLTLIPI